MEITKIFKFEACHSVADAYTDRCDRMRGGLHGHSYVVEVNLEGTIKEDGMVMDFSLVKEKINHIIDAFDHTFVVNNEDRVMVKLAPYLSARFIFFPSNPTAENMAEYFCTYIDLALSDKNFTGTDVKSVTVWETTTGKATGLRHKYGYTENSLPPLLVSAAIAEKWTVSEVVTFEKNNGVILTPFPLIRDLDVEVIESESTLKIIASTIKNCK
jgi:queuosine biosynthesis protein QueD